MNAKAITFGILKAIGILLGGVILIWLLIKIKALILYIGIASFIALLCRPMVLFLQEKLKFHRTLSSLTTLLVVMLAIVGLLYIFVPIIVQQSKNISEIDWWYLIIPNSEKTRLKDKFINLEFDQSYSPNLIILTNQETLFFGENLSDNYTKVIDGKFYRVYKKN